MARQRRHLRLAAALAAGVVALAPAAPAMADGGDHGRGQGREHADPGRGDRGGGDRGRGGHDAPGRGGHDGGGADQRGAGKHGRAQEHDRGRDEGPDRGHSQGRDRAGGQRDAHPGKGDKGHPGKGGQGRAKGHAKVDEPTVSVQTTGAPSGKSRGRGADKPQKKKEQGRADRPADRSRESADRGGPDRDPGRSERNQGRADRGRDRDDPSRGGPERDRESPRADRGEQPEREEPQRGSRGRAPRDDQGGDRSRDGDGGPDSGSGAAGGPSAGGDPRGPVASSEPGGDGSTAGVTPPLSAASSDEGGAAPGGETASVGTDDVRASGAGSTGVAAGLINSAPFALIDRATEGAQRLLSDALPRSYGLPTGLLALLAAYLLLLRRLDRGALPMSALPAGLRGDDGPDYEL